MIKLCFFLLISALFAVVLSLGLEHNSMLTITWNDYEIEISLLASGIIFFICLLIFFHLFSFILSLKNFPARLLAFYKLRQNEQRIQAIEQGFNQMAIGNVNNAKKISKKLDNSNLEKLLKLQIAQAEGNDTAIESILTPMLTDNATKLIAFKGLITIKIKQQQFTAALQLAEAALKVVNKDLLKQELAYIYLRLAEQDLINNDKQQALEKAKKVIKLAPINIEAVLLYTKILLDLDKRSKAKNLLEHACKVNPDYRLVKRLYLLYTETNSEKKLVKIEKILTPLNNQALITLTSLALELNQLAKASSYLAKIEPHGNLYYQLLLELKIKEGAPKDELTELASLAFKQNSLTK